VRYPVNEIFFSMQGEGAFTGTPAAFVRMQGCPVGCPWCDTKHTWERKDMKRVAVSTILLKTEVPTEEWTWFTPEDIARTLSNWRCHHVVITGGEPCAHDLEPLTALLERAGYRAQIETSGTFEIKASRGAYVTVSPKIDMPGGRKVLQSALERADEIKYPVGRDRDVERLTSLILPHTKVPSDRVFLQPLSMSTKATELCINSARAKGWRVSVQTHKVAGVR